MSKFKSALTFIQRVFSSEFFFTIIMTYHLHDDLSPNQLHHGVTRSKVLANSGGVAGVRWGLYRKSAAMPLRFVCNSCVHVRMWRQTVPPRVTYTQIVWRHHGRHEILEWHQSIRLRSDTPTGPCRPLTPSRNYAVKVHTESPRWVTTASLLQTDTRLTSSQHSWCFDSIILSKVTRGAIEQYAVGYKVALAVITRLPAAARN